MSTILLITPLVPTNRAVMDYCDSVENAMKVLRCSFRRLDLEFPPADASPWWSERLPGLCALHGGIVVVAHGELAGTGHDVCLRELLSRIPPRTIVWIADNSGDPHANSVFRCAMRQDLNVFTPLATESALSVQTLEFLNFVYYSQQPG